MRCLFLCHNMGRNESRILEPRTPLLDTDNEAVDGFVDYCGRPVKRYQSGGWKAASFILAGGTLERFAYFGIESNLISYLTGPIGESVATAAANVNTWIGVVSLVPVLGAFLADSFIGRHRSIIISSLLYILGLGFLALIATISPASVRYSNSQVVTKKSGPDTEIQVVFFVSLYLVALGQTYRPCVQAFGADQFDGKHPKEKQTKNSFFNWWFCVWNTGAITAHLILHYIQDNVSWGIGFGIPCLAMIIGFVLFLLGKKTYRFPAKRNDEERPSRRVKWGFARVSNTLHEEAPASSSEENRQEDLSMEAHKRSRNARSSNNSSIAVDDYSTDKGAFSSKFKESKKVLGLLPIWISCLPYTIAHAQAATLFTKQATTVDRSIGASFNIPAATLRTFIPLTIMSGIAIYDRIFVPVATKITTHQSGITTLQRIGTGMAISVINMVVAALIEKKRLKIAQDFGLVDIPDATVPMSFWWLVPQYIIFGLASVFTHVGIQQFFYDQFAIELRSVGISCYYGAESIGNFLSSILVSIIDKATSQNGRESWFSNNLNRAHIDYFYWLLAGIGAVGLFVFMYISKSYIHAKKNDMDNCSQTGFTGRSVEDS